jgi:hypothetical protein
VSGSFYGSNIVLIPVPSLQHLQRLRHLFLATAPNIDPTYFQSPFHNCYQIREPKTSDWNNHKEKRKFFSLGGSLPRDLFM